MTVKEFNDWHRKWDSAYCFVKNIDHAMYKAGEKASIQMQCIGWSDEVKDTLIEALVALRDKKRSMLSR